MIIMCVDGWICSAKMRVCGMVKVGLRLLDKYVSLQLPVESKFRDS